MALEIFAPNTGQGDCTFIKFPNGKNMLVDINKTSTDVDIIEFLRDKVKKKYHSDIDKTCRRINYFVNTHPHEDHLRGIGDLNDDEFYIDEIWETTHRLYVPADKKSEYKHYYDFLSLVNKLKKRNAVRKLIAGRATFAKIGSSEIYVFGPSKYLVDSKSREEIHAQCGIFKIEYADNSILFAGDSNRDNWEDRIVPHYSDDKIIDGVKQSNLLKSTILHASHHGSKYFFVKKNNDDDKYERSIDKIKPRFTCISVGNNNNHGHPHKIALDIYN
jgi:beta-lactamase superfamily II metal-dependent hydrolase